MIKDLMDGKREKSTGAFMQRLFSSNKAFRANDGTVLIKRPATTGFAISKSQYEKASLSERVAGKAVGETMTKQRKTMLEKAEELRGKAALMKDLANSLMDSAKGQSKDVIILDEASLGETKHSAALKAYAEISGTRLIVTGDEKQHGSVGAGEAFRQTKEATKEAGGNVHELTSILRQSNKSLKEAVYDAVDAKTTDAIQKLQHGGAGTVTEISDRVERREQLAHDYVALSKEDREKTIIVDPARESGRLLSDSIREKLNEKGELKNERNYDVFTSKRLEVSEYKFADRYEVGDVLRDRKSGEIKGVITDVNKEKNTLTIEKNGNSKEINANTISEKKVDVGVIESKGFAVGDRIRMNATTNLGNKGSYATVVGHTDKGLRVEDSTGNRHTINIDQMRDATHGYVTTSHKAQGQTVDRAMINMDSQQKNLANLQTLYVALSRAKIEANLYTDKAASLAETINKNTGAKGSAVEVKQQTFSVSEGLDKNSLEYRDVEAKAKSSGGLLITVSKDGEIKSIRNFEGESKTAETEKAEAVVSKARQIYQAAFNKSPNEMTRDQLRDALNEKKSEIKELGALVKQMSKAKAIQDKNKSKREGEPNNKQSMPSKDESPKIENAQPTEKMVAAYEKAYNSKPDGLNFAQVRDALTSKMESIGSVRDVLQTAKELSKATTTSSEKGPTAKMVAAYEKAYNSKPDGLNFAQVRDAINNQKGSNSQNNQQTIQAKTSFQRDANSKSPDRNGGQEFKRDQSTKSPERSKDHSANIEQSQSTQNAEQSKSDSKGVSQSQQR
jgi:hypothetical protein